MRKYLTIIFILVSSTLSANEVGIIEFINRPVNEILFVLGEETGIHMLPDETISGVSSFYFSGGDPITALNLFLEQNHLYKNEKDSYLEISKVRVVQSNDSISIDAYQVNMAAILRKISDSTNQTILFDPIQDIPTTIHIERNDIFQILEILIESIPNHSLSVKNEAFFIQRDKTLESYNEELYFLGKISSVDGLYNVDIQKGQLSEAINRLFSQEGKEYVLLSDQQVFVENIRLNNKPFYEILHLILEQSGMRFVNNDEIYYILDANKESILRQFKTQIRIEYKNRSVKEITDLIPSELIPDGRISIDVSNNSVILYGTPEEILPLENFIKSLDQQVSGWVYRRYDLNYLSFDIISKTLPDHLSMVSLKPISLTKAMLVFMPEDCQESFDRYLEQIDIKPNTYPVHLKYIKAKNLLDSLPPGFYETEFIGTDDDSLVFFQGNMSKYNDLLIALENIDSPIPQIRYDLLVIQYQENQEFNWDINFSNSVLDSGDQTAFLGELGSVASLAFDITSAFGYMFSIKLNTDISQSRARVMADTTLNGLTNQEVSLQNTNTFRYRDTVKDPDTGNEEVTGISREITSGLFIKIKGWVSGDDMITMDVSTTVSRQEDVSSNDAIGVLPPTSEKVVNTHVRTRAGKPVIIGGLIQTEKSEVVQKVPFFGDIPLIGLLFQKRKEILENTEMVIYIVPHLEIDSNEIQADVELRRLYDKYSQYLP
jgi:general secretion pathway protein D